MFNYTRIGILFALSTGVLSAQNSTRPLRDDVPQPAGYDCGNGNVHRSIELRDMVIAALDQQPQLIVARQEVEKARANLTAALTPFLPSVQATFEDERFVPDNGSVPVTVVGNNVLGGTQTYSSHASIGLNWNLFSGGRDLAGYRGARADVRSSEASFDSQLDDTLTGVLQAYNDVLKAQRVLLEQRRVVSLLKEVEARAEERFRGGTGTTIAVGQASNTALEAEQTLFQACRSMADKSIVLARAAGLRFPPGVLFAVSDMPVAMEAYYSGIPEDTERLLRQDPAVSAAQENVTAAEEKLRQAKAAYGPTLAIVARREYLGQDPDGIGGANRSLGPNSYRYGLVLQQPLLPFTSESAQIASARADVRKAQANYSQALLEAEGKLQSALSARQEAASSAKSARLAVENAQRILTLTQSLYKAGRTDLDNLQHAEINLERAQSIAQTVSADLNVANWILTRSLGPKEFPAAVMKHLGIERTQLR